MSRISTRAVWALWSVAAWWRGVYQPWWAAVPVRVCSWPDCLSQERVDRMCFEIHRELLGEEVPQTERLLIDFREQCGCVEPGVPGSLCGEPPF